MITSVAEPGVAPFEPLSPEPADVPPVAAPVTPVADPVLPGEELPPVPGVVPELTGVVPLPETVGPLPAVVLPDVPEFWGIDSPGSVQSTRFPPDVVATPSPPAEVPAPVDADEEVLELPEVPAAFPFELPPANPIGITDTVPNFTPQGSCAVPLVTEGVPLYADPPVSDVEPEDEAVDPDEEVPVEVLPEEVFPESTASAPDTVPFQGVS